MVGCLEQGNRTNWPVCKARRWKPDEKREAIWKRELVNRAYFVRGYSKRAISQLFDVSLPFVVKWTQSENQDFEEDGRGWEKGRRRKWGDGAVERIKGLRQELEENPEEAYWGPTAIQLTWRERYPDEKVPPVRTIGQILTDLGMTNRQKEKSGKGALRYLHYPEYTVYEELGERILEADFVGEKFIRGRSEPIHFLGWSFKQPPRLRHYTRVEAETSEAFRTHTAAFFDRFEVPDHMKVDNALAMIGSRSHPRTISRSVEFLLEHEVIPIFAVPRRPATQASMEGNNSVFGRKFWNRNDFSSVEEIDELLEVFNRNSREYLQYRPPEHSEKQGAPFEPKVYFLRQVHESEETGDGVVSILNGKIKVPPEYIKYFVLGEWRLEEEKLLIHFERDKQTEVIEEREFAIHEESRERCQDLLK